VWAKSRRVGEEQEGRRAGAWRRVGGGGRRRRGASAESGEVADVGPGAELAGESGHYQWVSPGRCGLPRVPSTSTCRRAGYHPSGKLSLPWPIAGTRRRCLPPVWLRP
jgi:hypothetical protein